MSWDDRDDCGMKRRLGEDDLDEAHEGGRKDGIIELAQLILDGDFESLLEVREYLQQVIKHGDTF